jgi:uncharacterized membrane protein (UPF0136 family)
MTNVAIAITFLYAAVSLLGGILGIMKGSTVSLVAGGAAAVLLAAGAWFGQAGKTWGLVLALVVCVALVGRFLPGFLKNMSENVWPAGVMAVLGIVTAVVLVLGILAMRRG